MPPFQIMNPIIDCPIVITLSQTYIAPKRNPIVLSCCRPSHKVEPTASVSSLALSGRGRVPLRNSSCDLSGALRIRRACPAYLPARSQSFLRKRPALPKYRPSTFNKNTSKLPLPFRVSFRRGTKAGVRVKAYSTVKTYSSSKKPISP